MNSGSRLCVLEFFIPPQFFVARSSVLVFASQGILPVVIFLDLVLYFIDCLVYMSPASVPVLLVPICGKSAKGALVSCLFSLVCELIQSLARIWSKGHHFGLGFCACLSEFVRSRNLVSTSGACRLDSPLVHFQFATAARDFGSDHFVAATEALHHSAHFFRCLFFLRALPGGPPQF
jgi:hypothetical protein